MDPVHSIITDMFAVLHDLTGLQIPIQTLCSIFIGQHTKRTDLCFCTIIHIQDQHIRAICLVQRTGHLFGKRKQLTEPVQ